MTQVIRADELTADYGESDSRRIRRHIFTDLSILAGDLALHYVRAADRTSYEQANQVRINQLRGHTERVVSFLMDRLTLDCACCRLGSENKPIRVALHRLTLKLLEANSDRLQKQMGSSDKQSDDGNPTNTGHLLLL